MCGIFGIFTKNKSSYSDKLLKKTLEHLAKFSESRGKDSSGLAFRNNEKQSIDILKGPLPVTELLKESEYKNILSKNLHNEGFSVIGHSRLVTNGSQLDDVNNQPVIKDGIVGIHNGIIVNVDELWDKHQSLERKYEVDTEVLLSIVRDNLVQEENTANAVSKAIQKVFGTVAIALYFDDKDEIILATNNGSLYILTNKKDILIFASEGFILSTLLKDRNLLKAIGNYELKQIVPNSGYHLELNSFEIRQFDFENPIISNTKSITDKYLVNNFSKKNGNKQLNAIVDIASIHNNPKAKYEESLLEYNIEEIQKLKRCSKCLLPETFPFIEFDEDGVCNYCKNYKLKNQPKPIDELHKLLEPYRKANGVPDVIIPFSGGRDSTFVLHTVKKELGLNPIAYTYDWGMVTDLARRNIARVCGRLGVENIIVSADIHKKRKNIRKNILAWLKYPELGMIPLFMAGDKYFFYYCNQIKKQTNIDLNIWGVNYLENTDFKTGFAGLKPEFNKERIYSLSKLSQLRLFGFIGRNLLCNPSYINSSVWDTFGSFFVRYIAPKKDYYHLFDYYRWDENEIEKVILEEYEWETAIDTRSTWRIGDGTASFYNYVYFTIAGFSEIETFRSNQIREGMLTREEGIKVLEEENRPRFESIKWYLEIVDLDFETVIKKINQIPKLY